MDRLKLIKRASWVGIVANGILAVLCILIGILAGSFSVVGIGIDTSTDIITSFITLIATLVASKPPDKEHPYGHGKAEAVAAKLVSFCIFFAGAQLGYMSILRLINRDFTTVPGILALTVSVFSVIVKIFLAVYKYRIGKKVNSSMVLADAMNMRNDVLLSLTVFAGLFFTIYFKIGIIDLILALLLSLFIIRVAYKVFMESANELLECSGDPAVYGELFGIANTVEGVERPHRTRVRKLGNSLVIDMDIEVDPELPVFEAHKIACNLEEKIRDRMPEVYDIVIHIEPRGNVEENEKYGVSEDNYRES